MKNTVEKKRKVTPAIAFMLGALGKLFATSVTYPYITVKSQMHVAAHSEKKEGMSQTLRRVVKDEGYAGLYKGESADMQIEHAKDHERLTKRNQQASVPRLPRAS